MLRKSFKYNVQRVTVELSHEMLRNAMVNDKPGGLSVQPPPPPGEWAAQLKSPLPILVYLKKGTTFIFKVRNSEIVRSFTNAVLILERNYLMRLCTFSIIVYFTYFSIVFILVFNFIQ